MRTSLEAGARAAASIAVYPMGYGSDNLKKVFHPVPSLLAGRADVGLGSVLLKPPFSSRPTISAAYRKNTPPRMAEMNSLRLPALSLLTVKIAVSSGQERCGW